LAGARIFWYFQNARCQICKYPRSHLDQWTTIKSYDLSFSIRCKD